MYKVVNIGTYDNNHKLYEVTSNTRHGKTKYREKATYIVDNRDADKFEHLYEKQNKLYDYFNKYDNPEFQKKASLKLKIGTAIGGIIGAGLPLSVFAFTKNKIARTASVLASFVGLLVGSFCGVALTTWHGIIPNQFKNEFYKNLEEMKNLNVKKVKEEKEKIGEIEYKNRGCGKSRKMTIFRTFSNPASGV